jgi:OFA family oxalate/formate antiporter-like MFS transporter
LLGVIARYYGGTPTLLASALNGFFGPKNYQVILATATFSVAVAAIIGPLLSSKLQEISGGGYMTSFLMIIVVAIIAIFFSALMSVFNRKTVEFIEE